MKYLAAIALTFTIISSPVLADVDADRDITLVTKCTPKIFPSDREGLPPSVSIEVFSWSDTTKVCNEMMRVLEGVRHKDITNFEKAVAVLHFSQISYGTDDMQILKELIEIIRLRGLYDKPDRWYETNNLIVRAWNAFNGVVGPRHIITFLRSAGPDAAKGLSDDGLTRMIILMKHQYQRGD
ncbi:MULTISPECIES: hypothetical protein [Bradyrhizobium]|uniref:Uncharacterized protein n=2 Tax=Bradyrhizobium TaxID=374 RepID=A0ABY0PYW7_9BRAD|nr:MULTISPECIES: hypothetical protein [Bradyrhizobium]SDJ17626.1 hypothetical protein SAMN05444163_4750 [Bradyrhizobium ottawaense]SEC85024.1 hypothetical protein SAMN05444171_2413 [Bradyrhizobium lablabi]